MVGDGKLERNVTLYYMQFIIEQHISIAKSKCLEFFFTESCFFVSYFYIWMAKP